MTDVDEFAQQFNLKWTNHGNNILQMFSEQFSSEVLVDVTLSCEGRFLKAHKMVLSACSPYFQELFRVHAVEHPVIIMQGVKFSVLQQMIKFMYHGEVKVTDADLDSLLAVSESMHIKGLCSVRRERSRTDSSSMSEIVTTAAKLMNSYSKGRKRQKQSHSPNTSVVSHVNGESDSNIEAADPPSKVSKSGQTSSNKDNDDFNNFEQIKQLARPLSQLNTADFETVYDDKTMDKQGSKIPRPPNAFMIFATEWRKKLANEYPDDSNKEISIRLGSMWKSLAQHTKETFYAAARKADEEHKVKYPGYYYSPKEARIRKEMRGGNNYQRPSNSVLKSGIMKDIDATSLVTLVMPDDTRTDYESGNEEVLSAIKVEPEEHSIFDDDSNDVNTRFEMNNSPAEPVPTTSSAKE